MDEIVKGLGPAFAAGFAVQRTLEILDPLFGKLADSKKIVLSLVSLAMGLMIAYGAQLQVIHTLTSGTKLSPGLDMFVTGLIISGGTEGFNSIMKFLNYKKEETKASAVTKGGSPEQQRAISATASRF